MLVIKRDESEQEFDEQKIESAILKAMQEVRKLPDDEKEAEVITYLVCKKLNSSADKMSIEFIQDRVEEVLMLHHSEVAKAYILYRDEHAKARVMNLDPKAISDYIHASKYAKYLPDQKRRETYSETVTRSFMMHVKKFPELENEIGEAFHFVYMKKVLPSMRSMQFGGIAIEKHNARMYNCTFTLIDRTRVFQEIFYLLLCGSGVGFSVQKQHVAKLPVIGKVDRQKVLMHHCVDSIIGWADTVGLLLESYKHGLYFEPCYDLIRPEGAELKTGGGRAPGHLPLKKLVCTLRHILDGSVGRQLKPIECHDMICHIAEAVLAGGIRRSSLISLFSKDDVEMLSCKTPENFDYNTKNTQRAMANNSVVLLRSEATKDEFMQIMDLNRKTMGEPGFMFTDNLDHGMNPCGEIGIDPTLAIPCGYDASKYETGFGFCNLCEVNVAACETKEEFWAACEAAAFIGTLQASYTDIPYLGEVTKAIMESDPLLGVGLVGIMDNPDIGLNKDILTQAALRVVSENGRVADLIGINSAKRCTCVKPAGTSSLELGCVGSGIHPHHADRYFRRVTANVNEPVAQHFVSINPHMVTKKPNGDLCITFPVKIPKGALTIDHFTAKEFMGKIFDVFESWIVGGMRCVREGMGAESLTHNISSTVTLGEGDSWYETLDHAWENRGRIRAMSFFPKFGDKQIPYAPRERVLAADESRWKDLIENYKLVDYMQMIEETDGTTHVGESACSAGACDLVHADAVKAAEGIMFFTDPPSDGKYLYELTDKDLIIDICGFEVMYGKYRHIKTP